MAFIAGAIMIGAGAGAVLGIAGGIMEQRAAAKAADRRRKAEIAGAKSQYAMTEASVNLMKGTNREAAANTIMEVLRAGAAQDKRVKGAVQEASSTMSASNEGLTSGRSKGRQMVALQVEGTQAVLESKSKTAGTIVQITDQMDKATNDLNNKLLSDWQKMATVLTQPGEGYRGSDMAIVSAGISGARSGASFGASMATAVKD